MPAASPDLSGSVLAVHRSGEHTFSKQTVDAVTLLPGLGVEGDAHLGARVKHRSRVAADPNQPNLRQVHLVMSELLDEVVEAGHQVVPGQLGENVTTTGLDLVGLPVGSMLRLGDTALVALTGLRNPCKQIRNVGDGERYGRPGEQVGRTGVMGVVVAGGPIRSGDPIEVRYPAGVLTPMQKV